MKNVSYIFLVLGKCPVHDNGSPLVFLESPLNLSPLKPVPPQISMWCANPSGTLPPNQPPCWVHTLKALISSKYQYILFKPTSHFKILSHCATFGINKSYILSITHTGDIFPTSKN